MSARDYGSFCAVKLMVGNRPSGTERGVGLLRLSVL